MWGQIPGQPLRVNTTDVEVQVLKNRITHIVVIALAIAALMLVGCGSKSATPKVEPKVAPPAIAKAGVLKVGVNLGSMPYAVEVDDGKGNISYAGYDVEVAKALASKLAVSLELVAVAPDKIASALDEGTCDIVMSAPIGADGYDTVADYAARSIMRYGATETDSKANPSFPIAVQKESPAHWMLLHKYGEAAFTAYPSTIEAIGAVEDGKAKEVAGDSLVLAYATTNGAKIVPIASLDDEVRLGIAFKKDNTALKSALTGPLKAMTDAQFFESLTRKWYTPVAEASMPSK